MIKNVSVVDEQGNKYGSTYYKRAKGLIKNGRAYFIDDDKICLVSLPDKSEDNLMTENFNEVNKVVEVNATPIEVNVPPVEVNVSSPTPPTSPVPPTAVTPNDVTLIGIFEQMTKIISHTDYLTKAVEEISEMSDEHHGAGMKAEAIGNLIHARERTNQQALQLLEKMFESLNPKQAVSNEELKRDIINNLIEHGYEDLIRDIIDKL